MNRNVFNYVVIFLLLFVSTASVIVFYLELRTTKEEVTEYTTLQEQFTTITNNPTIEFTDKSIDESEDVIPTIPPEWVGLPYLTVDFETLLIINPDSVGWIAIPLTPVSYPVVQTKNNTKYLTTSFNGNYSKAGTPFVDSNNDIQNLDTNTIIYSHNMGTGRDDMFSSLLEYKDYEYYLDNKYIQFDTIFQRYGWWEIFAVIEYDIRSNDFQYLQLSFINATDFMNWIKNAKELSVHDIDIDITPHDRILMLSTCDRGNYGRSGRMFILAVNIIESNNIQREEIEGYG